MSAAPAYAQFTIPGAAGALSITLNPVHPSPNSTVTLSLSSPLYDLENSTVVWRANGRTLKSGTGLTEASIITGALGEPTEITADIAGDSGTAHADVTIIPTAIDLLWEARSYTPPFYRGRALPSAGSSLTLVALPHFMIGGKLVAANNLTYTWRRDGEVLGTISGRGKSSVQIDAPTLYGANTISVEAVAQDGSISGEARIRLSDTPPRLYLYQDHPLFGILYNQALGPTAFVGDAEMGFVATPLFAPTRSAKDPALVYQWQVNRTDVSPAAENPNEITINAAKSTGIAQIQLSLTHTSNYFFSADATWNVTFTQAGAASTVANDPFRAQ